MNLLLLNFYISPEHNQVLAVEYVFEKQKNKILGLVKDIIKEFKEQNKEYNKYRAVDHVKSKLSEQGIEIHIPVNEYIDDL